MTTQTLPVETVAAGAAVRHDRVSRPAVEAAIDSAARKIAPLWPLRHFVAVNPFLGLTDLDFADAARTMAQVAGGRMAMPRRFYAAAIAEGRIAYDDLAEALAEAPPADGLPRDVAALKALALAGDAEPATDVLPTVADVAGRVTGRDWTSFVTERISGWAAAHFDDGQALWRSPWRDLAPFTAWRAEASLDRAPELIGIGGFRSLVKRLPALAVEAAVAAVSAIGVPEPGLEMYLHRLLMSVGGWAGYARYRVWASELRGDVDDTVAELLSVRLIWEWALLETFAETGLAEAWADACEEYATDQDESPNGLAVDLVLQAAYEKAWQRGLISRLTVPKREQSPPERLVQAAFCIDVRSEVFRRALESVDPHVETIGFAGFFGFPIEYVPLGHARGGAQCPVLLSPKFVIHETVKDADDREQTRLAGLRLLRRRTEKAWKSFKLAAVSSFGFVETMGLTFAGKLATDTLGLTRTVARPAADGLDRATVWGIGPRLAPEQVRGRLTGIGNDERLATAEAVLKAMSLTEDFSRLVMLVGHGSTTVNNPHATGLDCGACGGHTGEANARVAAAVLNDPAVRAGLAVRGISVPDETIFLGCLHDTTTDEVTIFDQETVPPSHSADLARLKERLAAAARLARAERAPLLKIEAGRTVDAAVIARSRDWSQVRPEWGLAGCAAFIAAPRHRTAGVDLGGRSFLHSYDWRQDEGFGTLELIMTAPMVVASWISLQYYGSAVDNRVFGSGNKVLHNVVGTLGVLEGTGGDLRSGFPWQSVHDGERLVHEPLRLTVLIEAPTEAISAVIARHESVRQLVDNGWLHLFAIDGSGVISHRYIGSSMWKRIAACQESLNNV